MYVCTVRQACCGPFILKGFFLSDLWWLMWLNEIFWVTVTVGVWVHVLCFVRDRRLLGLELTVEPVSHWLIRPMWQTRRETIQICKSHKPSVGRGYYLGPVSVWADCHLGYTVFHLSSWHQPLSCLDLLLLLAEMFSLVFWTIFPLCKRCAPKTIK